MLLTRGRRGKCGWVWHTMRFNRLHDALPERLRQRTYLRWPFHGVVRCNEPATAVGSCDHFAGYDGLPVCDQHLQNIEASNRLDKLIKSGELGRQLRAHEAGEVGE